MKTIMSLFSSVFFLMLYTAGVSATTVYTFEATLGSGYGSTQYFEDTYGIGANDTVTFVIAVDYLKQGYTVSDDGSVHVLADVPYENGCIYPNDCRYAHDYAYAELIDSSIDLGLILTSGETGDHYVHDQTRWSYMQGESYYGSINLGLPKNNVSAGGLHISSESVFDDRALVSNWAEDKSWGDAIFSLDLADNHEHVRFSSFDIEITDISYGPSLNPVPLPTAAWLFLSGIGGCCIFRRKSK
ncbi:MAG: hypothetical protein D6B28_07305 [Gammaproteobacteria bacterium]|nr:MAG: hypothetical protein D6B28_07305 [Gammaproteobacteria bacterium]